MSTDTQTQIAKVDTFLYVPFVEKDEAKRLGAWWHTTAYKWYIPEFCKSKSKQELLRRWGTMSELFMAEASKRKQMGYTKWNKEKKKKDNNPFGRGGFPFGGGGGTGGQKKSYSRTYTPKPTPRTNTPASSSSASSSSHHPPPPCTQKQQEQQAGKKGTRGSVTGMGRRTRRADPMGYAKQRHGTGTLNSARVQLDIPSNEMGIAVACGAVRGEGSGSSSSAKGDMYAPVNCDNKQELVNRWMRIDLSSIALDDYIESLVAGAS